MVKPTTEILIRATKVVAEILSRAGHIDDAEITVYEPEGDDQYIDLTILIDDVPIEYDVRLHVTADNPGQRGS